MPYTGSALPKFDIIDDGWQPDHTDSDEPTCGDRRRAVSPVPAHRYLRRTAGKVQNAGIKTVVRAAEGGPEECGLKYVYV